MIKILKANPYPHHPRRGWFTGPKAKHPDAVATTGIHGKTSPGHAHHLVNSVKLTPAMALRMGTGKSLKADIANVDLHTAGMKTPCGPTKWKKIRGVKP